MPDPDRPKQVREIPTGSSPGPWIPCGRDARRRISRLPCQGEHTFSPHHPRVGQGSSHLTGSIYGRMLNDAARRNVVSLPHEIFGCQVGTLLPGPGAARCIYSPPSRVSLREALSPHRRDGMWWCRCWGPCPSERNTTGFRLAIQIRFSLDSAEPPAACSYGPASRPVGSAPGAPFSHPMIPIARIALSKEEP